MEGVFVLLFLLAGWFGHPCHSKLVADEVAALQEIVHKLGTKYWTFNDASCQIETFGMSPEPLMGYNSSVHCDCHFENNACHVVSLVLKDFSLPGILPPALVKLPYLQVVDFAYNSLSGEIPREWAQLQLTWISLSVNRLSGEIPKFLARITSLRYLSLEANQFSGTVPPELGNLTNLKTLMLSSNQLSGTLPVTLAGLKNLTDFRINANNFSGTIPSFMSSWKQLNRLEMHASGLAGPIPPEISYLNNLTQLRISDINGTFQGFPVLSNMTGLAILILRNCNISGEIPGYLWKMQSLQLLDLSFNNLVGDLPAYISAEYLKVLFLTGNSLSGNVPSTILKAGLNIDLSYNNFTWQGRGQPACQANLNLNINLFRSSSAEKGLRRLLPCLDTFDCPHYGCSFHVNCGGDDVIIKGDEGKIVYEGDGSVEGGDAVFFINSASNWGFSSTGDFMDDNNHQNIRYIETLASSNLSTLYTTARVTPITLTYYSYCLENGNYTVNLHFAEIRFTNGSKYTSLGRRIFDIYIQDKLVYKDFNIEAEAHGVQKPLVKSFNASVTNGSVEIRFYWAGKGTTRIPYRGVYGPLISAISVHPADYGHCSNSAKRRRDYIIIGACVFIFIVMSSVSLLIWWKKVINRGRKRAGLGGGDNGVDIALGGYTLKQIKAATNNFDPMNKIGEGGFGPVYKGLLPDGTTVAVKQLSTSSKQGNREFLNEIGIISCLNHPNLVRLHGCCTQGDQLLLVYEYMENNSLASSLFDPESCVLDWPTRVNIFMGVAQGLAFLHEESRLKIVHRDIKATNVLLDKHMNAKISDFGLARLGEEDKTHITTKAAGTIGYMAPEYALWGYLTDKADVYSFGILALEIISGKSNNCFTPPADFFCLLDWACHLQQRGDYRALIDEKLQGSELVDMEEAERMVKVGLLCTNGSPSIRPTMSEVVSMLQGETQVPQVIPEAGTFSDDTRFKAMRDVHRHRTSTNTTMTSSTLLLTDAALVSSSLPPTASTYTNL